MTLSPVDPSLRVAASTRAPGPSVPTTAPAATGTVIPFNAPTEGDFAKVLQSLAQPPPATSGTLATPALGTGLTAGQGSYALPALPALQGYAMQAVPAGYAAIAAGTGGPGGTQPVSSLSGLGGVQSATAVGTVGSTLGTSSLNGMIQQAAAASGVLASLIAAVVQAESGGDATAVSGSGAKGLMQLMDGTAAAYGVTNSFDPQQNLMGGSRFLRSMLDQFGGNAQLALAAYNAGPAAVTRYGGVPPYGETQSYVQKVLAAAQQNIIG
jgi:soluble lytic murein transglycosylase-like protein